MSSYYFSHQPNCFVCFVPEWNLFEFSADFSEKEELFKDFNKIFLKEFSKYDIPPNSIFHFRFRNIQNTGLEFLTKFFRKISESESPKICWYLYQKISGNTKIEIALPKSLHPYQSIIQILPYEEEEIFDKIGLLLLSKNPADKELAFQLLESQERINQVYLQELILKIDKERATKYLFKHQLFEYLTIRSPAMELDLSNQGLTEVPKVIPQLKGLKTLNLSHNPIAEIPTDLFELDTLEELDLSYTDLVTIPEEIFLLENLKSLNVSHTPLEKLPESILNLHYLERLELVYTFISDNLIILSQIKSLIHLSINEKQVQKLTLLIITDCVPKQKTIKELLIFKITTL